MGRVQVVCGDDRRRTLTIREFTLLTLLLLIHCDAGLYAPNIQLLLLLLSPFCCPLLNSITTPWTVFVCPTCGLPPPSESVNYSPPPSTPPTLWSLSLAVLMEFINLLWISSLFPFFATIHRSIDFVHHSVDLSIYPPWPLSQTSFQC